MTERKPPKEETSREFVARMKRQLREKYGEDSAAELERIRKERWARLDKAEKPLQADLNRVLYRPVDDGVWDLVNRAEEYSEAIPVLIEHLSRDYPWEIKDGIARALTVPYAGRDAYDALREEFVRIDVSHLSPGDRSADREDKLRESYNGALGNGMARIASKLKDVALLEDLLALAVDGRHRNGR